MTAFILVAGAHTGSWIWQAVADRLRESRAPAYPVTLTGMGDRGHAAGPDTDLETHIHDLLRVIDRTDAAEVVLVGHCYGIYPVLGAADRRPERIARIVHLDAGMPQDGDQALTLVPDQAVRDRLLHRAGPADDDWRIPPPPLGEWQRWGSVAGLSPAVLARLATRAVPQPVGTLTRSLRLSKAVSELPRTGVLCTANGSSIAMVEALVGLGDPRFQVLTDPRVSFFELDTGHWPMLSRPDEVAETLMRAAAGEGHRVAAKVNEQPAHLRPFLMEVPERPRERVGRVDLHLPDDLAEGDHPRPAVVFVHGGPVHPDVRPTPRDWPGFVGYGQYVAGLGAVGVTLDHRLHDLADYGRAAEDIAEAVDLVRADPRVDGDRVALWCFSSGGLLSADWLAAPPSWLRCVAASYPILAPLPNWGLVDSRFRPADAVRTAGRLPIVLTRVELERAEIAVTVEEFLAAAEKCDADVEVIDVPLGHHGFETIDRTEQARDAVERAVRSVLGHLRR
ncbi:alpha/beta fold hydrolase [Streptomyces mirabilis]|uniref:alpha/beta hydrolase n=1 Tax=Streptomyces TaxID=1883 RepID=UPI001162DFAA|nr:MULTISPECIES: alpha/beta hydrolase [Streptomyces]MCX4613419.1 alpha/beta fold hydrolase [Streptomyces mirabilis]QDN91515.1 alpha/beta fold hydrolase [Streptomyces sp. RLB3-6]QDO12339.1 alpha/beta fold hydrolase [Streptomyces sp. S1D4-23]